MTRLIFILCIVCFAFLLLIRDAFTSFPKVPPLEMALNWEPMPDRTLQVDFEEVSFRYEILDDKPAPSCQMVLRLPYEELRWVTRPSQQAHQYLTKAEPTLYKMNGDNEWLWLSLKTYKDCINYDWDKLQCRKTQ